MKNTFPFFENNPHVTYLDSANTTQKPAKVLQGMATFYAGQNATIGRGLYEQSESVERMYIDAKKKIRDYIGADDAHEIISTYSSTYAANLTTQILANNQILKSGDTVLLSVSEHHANIVPWMILKDRIGIHVRFVDLDEHHRIDLDHLRDCMHEDVAVVSLQHVSNVTGARHNLERVRSIIGEGCIFVVDGAQSVSSGLLDVGDIDCDFAFFSGHKMYASMGAGVLYGKKKWLKQWNPPIGGGGSINYVTQENFAFSSGYEKWEPGIQNIAGMISMRLAIDFMQTYRDNIAQHQQNMVKYIREQSADKLGSKATLYHDDTSCIPIFSYYCPGHHMNDIADMLADRDICVRSGHHCCEPLHQSWGVPGTLRASFSIYNTFDDVDLFFDAFRSLI